MNYKHLSENEILNIQDTFLESDDLNEVSNLFKLLGDNTRLKILLSLFDNELCVHDISKVVEVSQSAISHQLRNLREANIVKFRKEGKEVLYSLSDSCAQKIINIGINHTLAKE